MIRLLCVVIGYCFGLFQTAYIIGRLHGIDIRDYGSGNSGTTNMLRTLGTKAGLMTFAGDCLKCLLALLVVRGTIGRAYPDIRFLLGVYAALGCILGHNFPFYMNFKGGKGIASTAGLVLGYPWQMVIVCMISFFAPALLTHYVSLGSLILNITVVAGTVVCGQKGMLGLTGHALTELYVVIILIAALAFYQHRENIGRLLAGKERKTYLFKKKK